jgi:hypothetical protein
MALIFCATAPYPAASLASGAFVATFCGNFQQLWRDACMTLDDNENSRLEGKNG